MTDLKKLIEEKLAECEKATPGPWEWTSKKGKNRDTWDEDNPIDGKCCSLFSLKEPKDQFDDCEVISSCDGCRNLGESEADLQFIAHSRTLLPATLRALLLAVQLIDEILDDDEYGLTLNQEGVLTEIAKELGGE